MGEDTALHEALWKILRWNETHRRSLPWREEPTAYHVWISEIMLQQTRIEAVIPYYGRFLAALPDVAALAAVEEERLMKLWQGLGYYSRARNLKRAAEKLMAEYGGLLPASAKELKKLPGIGDYTAGAIASLAFGLPEPAVDGNVLRVLSRLLASEEDVMLPATREKMTALLRENYPAGREAGLLTEGLMELGEVVCLPNGQPKCDLCPVHALCLAHRAGRETALPVRAQPKPRRREERTILLLRAGEKYALSRRPKPGLLAGLWEFPGLEGFWDEAALRERFPAAVGITPLGRAKHIFTHIEWHMRGFLLLLPEEIPGYTWATPAEIRQSYAIPTAFKAWVGKLQDETNRGLTGE